MSLAKFKVYYAMVGGIIAVIIGIASLILQEWVWGIIALVVGAAGIYWNVRRLKKLKSGQ